MGLVAIACGLIVALGALGASIGIAMVGSKYLESSARQPELIGPLQTTQIGRASCRERV